MEKDSSYNLQEKWHLTIIQNHMGMGDFEGAAKAIEKAMKIHEKSILLKVSTFSLKLEKNSFVSQGNENCLQIWQLITGV